MTKDPKQSETKEASSDNQPLKDEALLQKIETMESELLAAQEALQKAEEAKLRALSEMENMRRRTGEEKVRWSSFAVGEFLKNALPKFLELKIGAEHSNDEDLKKVIQAFFVDMEKSGLIKIEPQAGDPVDPHIHEVLMSEEGEPGKVVRTLEIGWKFGDTILRPAKVSAAQN